jgi:exodeoxyribonuclease III
LRACRKSSAPTTAFRPGEFEKIGYRAIWHGQKGFNGVAILADGIAPAEAGREPSGRS